MAFKGPALGQGVFYMHSEDTRGHNIMGKHQQGVFSFLSLQRCIQISERELHYGQWISHYNGRSDGLYGGEFAFTASVDEGTILGRNAAVHGILFFVQSS
jgi:hypothetical protein